MEGLAKALQQPEYVHVILNHLPITGLLVALVGLLIAICVKGRATLIFALAMVGVLGLSAWPVAHYGEQGFDRTLAMSDEAGARYLEHHQVLANRWIFLFYLTSGAAVAAMMVGWKWPRYLRLAAGLVAVLALSSLVAGAVIAEYGGQIRHREFRHGPPPAKVTAEPAEN